MIFLKLHNYYCTKFRYYVSVFNCELKIIIEIGISLSKIFKEMIFFHTYMCLCPTSIPIFLYLHYALLIYKYYMICKIFMYTCCSLKVNIAMKIAIPNGY